MYMYIMYIICFLDAPTKCMFKNTKVLLHLPRAELIVLAAHPFMRKIPDCQTVQL